MSYLLLGEAMSFVLNMVKNTVVSDLLLELLIFSLQVPNQGHIITQMSLSIENVSRDTASYVSSPTGIK